MTLAPLMVFISQLLVQISLDPTDGCHEDDGTARLAESRTSDAHMVLIPIDEIIALLAPIHCFLLTILCRASCRTRGSTVE